MPYQDVVIEIANDDDNNSYIVLGHHYDEIADVVRIAKWVCIFVSCCVLITVIITIASK